MLKPIKFFFHITKVLRIFAGNNALFPLCAVFSSGFLNHFIKIISNQNAVGRPGERLAKALIEAGPGFVKVGQALSTRSDIFGEQFAEDLANLQDRLPPFPIEQVRQIIESGLNKTISDAFSSFDISPIAAASIAQVHFAVTTEGEKVAVKILRPDIEKLFSLDIETFTWLASFTESINPKLERFKFSQIIKTIENSVKIEMDLRLEGAAAEELAINFKDDTNFCIPKVDWNRTTQRILTTERLNGIPIDNRKEILAAGFDPEEILKKATEVSFAQVFRDGFFHADVHPGNMFVLKSGAIGVVDFGIMGRLDFRTRKYLGEILVAFLNRDYTLAANLHFKASWIPPDQPVNEFAQACRAIAEPIINKPQNKISVSKLLKQLLKVSELFNMETQPQLLLLQKTMLVAEGNARKLCPKANMWQLSRPLMENWMMAAIGPEAQIGNKIQSLYNTLENFPELINDVESSSKLISSGRVKLHPETIKLLKESYHEQFLFHALCIFLLLIAISFLAFLW